MVKNKWREKIEELGYSYRKEILKIVLSNLILIISFCLINYFLKQLLIISFSVLAMAFINYYLFSFYSNKKAQLEKAHSEELISLLSYFQTFINNKNTVYQSFQKLEDFSSHWMKEKIVIFLANIDRDKSVKPFMSFALNFTSNIIKNLMLSIYQMVDQGQNSLQLSQFTVLFQSITNNYNAEMKVKKQKSLSQMTAFPLLGAGAIVMILSFSIISVVGDMVNVL